MIKYIILSLTILQCCLGHTNDSKQSVKIEESNNSIVTNNDSVKILTSLYNEARILEYSTIKAGVLTHEISRKRNQITAKVDFKDYDLSYNIVFEDTAHLYNGNDFVPSESYKYIDSYIKIGADTLKLKNKVSVNDSIKIEPINFWYGDDYGIHGRYYKLEGNEIILLRGLNMFCNGNYCTNYKILAIQREGVNKSIHYINTYSSYPIDFENTLLFEQKNEFKPYLFILKSKRANVISKKDLDLYIFEKNKILKTIPLHSE